MIRSELSLIDKLSSKKSILKFKKKKNLFLPKKS